ncbi:hypothetical protein A9Q99_16765 [Gammaproteobacteria bacterium 45_16_T64]|nr:hypothetical protein A9Q99_16765 [Gammaproteobacteria bacterium 45_16_T64]
MADFEQDLQKYRRQMDIGFRNLSFPPEMEAEYISQYFERNIAKQRTALWVSSILVLMLTPFDLFLLSGKPQEFYTLIRVGMVIPLLVVAYICTYIDVFQRHFQALAFLMVLFIGLSTNLCVAYAAKLGQTLPAQGLILIIFVGFLLAGLRFRHSLSSACILFISYCLLAIFYMPRHPLWIHEIIFIFGSCLIGGASAFTLEYQSRLGFLQKGALRSAAKIDPLTNLLNRGAINQQLEIIMDYAFREKKFITMVLLDVDYFKRYNDNYGHLAGDACLIEVAKALSKGCRRSLDFAGRYGGEEFILVWFDTKPEEMDRLSTLISSQIEALNIPHEKSKVAEYITLSGGMVTGIPSEALTSNVYIQKADDLLYESKNRGRSRILCYTFPAELSELTQASNTPSCNDQSSAKIPVSSNEIPQ